jgi:hypothetical protein
MSPCFSPFRERKRNPEAPQERERDPPFAAESSVDRTMESMGMALVEGRGLPEPFCPVVESITRRSGRKGFLP